eukprot:6773463-Prymnesium_polylepis.1
MLYHCACHCAATAAAALALALGGRHLGGRRCTAPTRPPPALRVAPLPGLPARQLEHVVRRILLLLALLQPRARRGIGRDTTRRPRLPVVVATAEPPATPIRTPLRAPVRTRRVHGA